MKIFVQEFNSIFNFLAFSLYFMDKSKTLKLYHINVKIFT